MIPSRLTSNGNIQADGFLWMAHSFSTLSSLKDELEIGAQAGKKTGPKRFGCFRGFKCRGMIKTTGGGLKHFLFSPLPGEMIQFDEHIFQMGWFKNQIVMKWGIPIKRPGFQWIESISPDFFMSWLRCTNPRVINETE